MTQGDHEIILGRWQGMLPVGKPWGKLDARDALDQSYLKLPFALLSVLHL